MPARCGRAAGGRTVTGCPAHDSRVGGHPRTCATRACRRTPDSACAGRRRAARDRARNRHRACVSSGHAGARAARPGARLRGARRAGLSRGAGAPPERDARPALCRCVVAHRRARSRRARLLLGRAGRARNGEVAGAARRRRAHAGHRVELPDSVPDRRRTARAVQLRGDARAAARRTGFSGNVRAGRRARRRIEGRPARLAPGSLQAQLEIFGDRCEPLDALRRRVLRAAAGLSMQDAVAHPLLDERERLYRLFMHSVQASHWAGDAPYAARCGCSCRSAATR